MSLVGLSPALGTLLAGVVLANSEFRHELESDIEPFKGLLLGLFFITVGAGIDFSVLANQFLLIIALTVGLITLKALVLLALALVFRIYYGNRWLFSLSLAQAGEFGFVLLSFAVAQHVLPGDLAQLLSLVVGLSMFLTPLLFIAYEKVIAPKFQSEENQGQPDTIDEQGAVIIAGMGRFGQVVNRMLVANGIATVAMDQNARQIDLMRRIKVKSYFGDASRPDLLHSAGIDSASAIVVALDDRSRALELVQHIKHHHPNVKVLARAFDRGHYYELCDAGADFVISETYHSAVELAGQALIDLGAHPFRAEQSKMDFIDTENYNAEKLYQSWKHEGEARVFDEHYRGLFIKMQEELFLVFNRERTRKHSMNERGWTPPPKNYTEDLDDDALSEVALSDVALNSTEKPD
jgi:CPA2 family monovalent cation:H+ antiporter-2/glutathione-regulated potassium-efflux system ancillary protein KefC